MSPKTWYAAEVRVGHQAREAVEYGLMEAGALGTETFDLDEEARIIGYFENPIDESAIRQVLAGALRIYAVDSERVDITIGQVVGRDWLAEWKKAWQPVAAGRFVIAPTWIHSPASGDSILIRIDPGMAFGTGTHETTRLCLKAVDRYFRGGNFLDVGTGTGVLAIAAAKMYSDARVEALDTDGAAIQIARENARLNQVADRIEFRTGTVDEQTASADLVCANLTAPVVVELLPKLLGTTCGRLVLSGILDTQVEFVQARLLDLGAAALELDQDGEWVTLVV